MSARVLIIDDEAEIRRNLTVGLTQEGYTCTACPDGISAVHELHKSREAGAGYDYLVTDIFMPDIDGLKILKVIKSEFPDLPVLVITGFGNEMLEATALAEYNTGFLDKPFEIPDLVAALKQLKTGASTAGGGQAAAPAGEIRESLSSYLTIRITDTGRDMEIYKELYFMEGVATCDAVRGDVDIILLAQASSQAEMDALLERIRGVAGIEIVSRSSVERPKLDTDVAEFIEIYQRAAKAAAQAKAPRFTGTRSYVIVDIDKESIQQVFTTLFFLDEIIFCDVIDDGSRLIGIVTESGAFGKTPRIVEKLGQIDGVLRVKEASIIKLIDF
ncbi:MAG: response regulator [Candidatus Krumholzibacteriota bacterium]|nr:response regulator [Candidatus Krumholzibacteriota bacterium]